MSVPVEFMTILVKIGLKTMARLRQDRKKGAAQKGRAPSNERTVTAA